jgi:hypothetical protein
MVQSASENLASDAVAFPGEWRGTLGLRKFRVEERDDWKDGGCRDLIEVVSR